MGYAILGLTALIAIIGFGRWALNAQPHEVRKVMGYILSAVLAGAALFLFARGAIWPALMVLTTAIPPLMRSSGWFPKPNSTPGQQSNVGTDWLDMTLDHDSGDMDGAVKQGPFAGVSLSDLTDTDIAELYDLLQKEDPEAARLLASYIERMRPHMTGDSDTSQQQEKTYSSSQPGHSGMSRDDALDILGLGGNPTEDEIQTAWRNMIARTHPDQGGSAWMAARVNEARDILLSK